MEKCNCKDKDSVEFPDGNEYCVKCSCLIKDCKNHKEEQEDDAMLPFFVYGTLRKGLHNHRFIAGAYNLMIRSKIKGVLSYSYGLPWVHDVETDNEVVGELYYIKKSAYESMLRILDRLEGHPQMYERKQITTKDGVKAWCYMVNHPAEGKIVKDGDYLKFVKGMDRFADESSV